MTAAPDQQCPDEAACHHACLVGCWRVAYAEPLSSAGYPGNVWPRSVRTEYGTVAQEGTPSQAIETAVVALTIPVGEAATAPAGELTLGPADGAGIPVIDLNELLDRLGGSVLNLTAQAAILRRGADRLDAEADQLRQLRDTLRGRA